MKYVTRHLVFLTLALPLAGCGAFSSDPYGAKGSLAAGQSISVNGKQNLYAIAQAHNVSMRDLIVLNNLKAPYNLRPGQTLVLPASANVAGASAVAPQPFAAPLGDVSSSPLSPVLGGAVESQELPPPVVSPKSSSATLAPLSTAKPASAPAVTAAAKQVEASPFAPPPPPPKPVTTLKPAVSAKADAPLPAATADDAAETGPTPEFVWPVQGTVLSGFGPKGQGVNNDGVNIGAPKGATVTAAAAGTVAYAGNEMKGFGNLVLIRHQSGWVSAYAHLDRILVTKDAVVAQGDSIGTVGKTGNIASPQLHFELRHNGKPVDPNGVTKTK